MPISSYKKILLTFFFLVFNTCYFFPKSEYEFIINTLTNYNSITKNDGFLRTGITLSSSLREISFGILATGIGMMAYLPLVIKNKEFNLKNWPYPDLEYLVGPTILSYILISYGYQYFKKSKVNVRILNKILENWQHYKEFVPEQLHETFNSLHVQYIKNNDELNLSEQEAQEIITKILKSIIVELQIKHSY